MKDLWRNLEGMWRHSAAAAEWRHRLGGGFDVLRMDLYVEKVRRMARSLPCRFREGCAHEIKARAGGYVGKCKDDDGHGCDDIPLTEDDVEVWQLNLGRLGRAVAEALDCETREVELGLERTRQIAGVGDGLLPIVLTLQHCQDDFGDVVARMVARFPDGFGLLAPTGRFFAAPKTELLRGVNAGFFSLEKHVQWLETGMLHAPRSGKDLFSTLMAEQVRRPDERRINRGRLGWLPDCSTVWLDGKPIDLRKWEKARACLQLLVDRKAFNKKSALHLKDVINPNVRNQCGLPPAPHSEVKIQDYFKDGGPVRDLCRKIVTPVPGTGRYFLNVD